MAIKKILDYVYGFEIYFIFDMDVERCKKQLVKIGYNIENWGKQFSQNGFAYVDDENGIAFIVIPSKKTSHHLHVVIAHECLHLTSQILRSVGIKLSNESEEAFTYYHTWLMQNFIDFVSN